MALSRLDLPNVISLTRILVCPVLFALILSPSPGYLLIAFVLFLAAAISDLWDGYLARKYGWITDTGKLLDPLADKLLLFTTLVPFLIVSRRPEPLAHVPWWGTLPIWVVGVMFVREATVQFFRVWAARRGSVVSAGRSGKIKALIQNIFSGALILWYALAHIADARGWQASTAWKLWSAFHGAVVGISLAVALFFTVYSMAVYYWENRRLLHGARV
jgi:CDP-diacylglycerol---glycerol-3-phosphate 3-phosphatidyltransferase